LAHENRLQGWRSSRKLSAESPSSAMLPVTFSTLMPKRLLEDIIVLDCPQGPARGEEHLEFDLGHLGRDKPSECIYNTRSEGHRKKEY
jgi:hypothetical protein